MSTKPINEGGPAFPRTGGAFEGPNTSEWASPQEGMSLRDWFAGQALAAKMAPGLIGYEDHAPAHRAELIRRLVRDCYEVSDALLSEREKARGEE